MIWVPKAPDAPRMAECERCDARYAVETLLTLELGRLAERAASDRAGSAEEVGRIILASWRAMERRADRVGAEGGA